MKLQEELDELLEDVLGRAGQALMKGSEVGPGDSVSARGWSCFEPAWMWYDQRPPWCVPTSLLRKCGQLQKMLTWLKNCGLHP